MEGRVYISKPTMQWLQRMCKQKRRVSDDRGNFRWSCRICGEWAVFLRKDRSGWYLPAGTDDGVFWYDIKNGRTRDKGLTGPSRSLRRFVRNGKHNLSHPFETDILERSK